MVPAGTMGMTMVELVGRWFADAHDLHLEIQSLASERMICIDGDSIPLDFCDGDNLLPCAAVNTELHSSLHVVDTAKLHLRDFDNLLSIPLPVRVCRRHGHCQRLAGCLSFQRRLEPGDDVPDAVNVGERFLAFGAFDQSAVSSVRVYSMVTTLFF